MLTKYSVVNNLIGEECGLSQSLDLSGLRSSAPQLQFVLWVTGKVEKLATSVKGQIHTKCLIKHQNTVKNSQETVKFK